MICRFYACYVCSCSRTKAFSFFFYPPDGNWSFICADDWGLFTAADAILLSCTESLTQSTQNTSLCPWILRIHYSNEADILIARFYLRKAINTFPYTGTFRRGYKYVIGVVCSSMLKTRSCSFNGTPSEKSESQINLICTRSRV